MALVKTSHPRRPLLPFSAMRKVENVAVRRAGAS